MNCVEDMLLAAEKYLVTVLKPNSPCKSMDDLRYHIYHRSKSQSFVDLPPTTFETKGHCLRAIYNTYQYIYAMVSESMPPLNPVHYGCEESDGLLCNKTDYIYYSLILSLYRWKIVSYFSSLMLHYFVTQSPSVTSRA